MPFLPEIVDAPLRACDAAHPDASAICDISQ
jgi:hypothetical protein